MTACLEVINGRYAGSTCILEMGDVCRVGSRAWSDLWLADDSFVEPSHCAVASERKILRVHDLSQTGTFVNGKRVTRDVVNHGDWLVAGTSLLFALEHGKSEDGFESVSTRLSRFLNSGESPSRYLGAPANS